MRRLLSLAFTVAPFLAGAIAALSARRDFRLLWMAVAATLGVRVVNAVLPPRQRVAVTAFMGFVGGMVASTLVAVLLGARGVVGVGAVAIVLAGCATIGAALGRGRAVTSS